MPKRRLLFVEDDVEAREMFELLLEDVGCEVYGCGTVAEASYAIAERGPFDLLLCDLGLPDGSGYDVLHVLRQRHPSMPAVAVSGYGMRGDVRRAIAEGFAYHLTTPVTVELMLAVIESFEEEPPSTEARPIRGASSRSSL